MSDADDTLDSWDKKVWTVERIEVLKKCGERVSQPTQ